mgnify:CR=1 FL=1
MFGEVFGEVSGEVFCECPWRAWSMAIALKINAPGMVAQVFLTQAIAGQNNRASMS